MRLRGRFVLGACLAALACAGVGTFMLARRVERGGVALIDRELRIGVAALERQWQLHHAERRRVGQAIAEKPYFRAYLLAGDRGQMGYFAQLARQAGADEVAIVDEAGNVLASEGRASRALATRRKTLGSDGTLAALDGRLADAFAIPVGTDRPIGALLLAWYVEAAPLAADAEPFGVEAALAADGAFASTLPPSLSSAARAAIAGDREEGEIGSGAERRQLRVAKFGGGRLLVAMPVARIAEVSTEAGRFLIALLAVVVVVIVGGALVVSDRISGPLRTLRRAAAALGDGDFAGSAAALAPLTRRADEFGALARAFAAAEGELGAIAVACGRWTSSLREAIALVERSAAAVASGAGRQGQRLGEVTALTEPLAKAQEASVEGTGGAQVSARAAAAAIAAADYALGRALAAQSQVEATTAGIPSQSPQRRFADEVAGQLRVLAEMLREERTAVARALEQVVEVRKRLEESMSGHIREKNRGAAAVRALADIGRLAEEHAREAEALQSSAADLKRGVDRLDETLRRFDVGAMAAAAAGGTARA